MCVHHDRKHWIKNIYIVSILLYHLLWAGSNVTHVGMACKQDGSSYQLCKSIYMAILSPKTSMQKVPKVVENQNYSSTSILQPA